MRRVVWRCYGYFLWVAVWIVFLSVLSQGQEGRADDTKAARLLKGEALAAPTVGHLNVSRVVAKKRDLTQAEGAAGEILREIVAGGDTVQVVHVMTYARVGNDRALMPVIRERLKKAENSWEEQHVKLGAMHALIALAGEKFPEEIKAYLKSPDVSIRSRAFMLARDSGDMALIDAVGQALASEMDSEMKAAGLSALARLEEGSDTARQELEVMAVNRVSGGGRARIELSKSGLDPPVGEGWSRVEEEQYRGMVLSGRHDERMHAIEKLAAHGGEGVRAWLRGLGAHEDWKHRMKSAYYLLVAGEKEEALKRLEGESHGLVQVTLLAALRTNSTKARR